MIERITDIDSENPDDLLWLGQSFYSEGRLPGTFNLECFRTSWRMLIKNDVGAIWKLQRHGGIAGGIGGLIYPDMNDGQLVAMETFWYVSAEHRGSSDGIRLVKIFEEWAALKQAKRIIMAFIFNSMPEAVKNFYEKHGYRALEMWYVKEWPLQQQQP